MLCAFPCEARNRWARGIDAVYEDLTLFEAVGLRPGDYDLAHQSKYSPTYGTVPIANPGSQLGAGLGARVVIGFKHGLRVQADFVDVKLGGVVGGAYPFSPGFATHFGMGAGFGWELILGRVVLHSATMIGFDSVSIDFDGPLRPEVAARVDPIALARNDFVASETHLRFGQQVGARVHLTRLVALIADGELDYDHTWHVDFGLGIGLNRVLSPN